MNIIPTHPLISCICITGKRSKFLIRSVICFDTQSYPNKELVISYPEDDLETKILTDQIIASSGLNIVTIARDPKISLGAARNEAIIHCNGEYICTWDDDDWYHYKRLIHQYNNLKKPGAYQVANVIDSIMIYDSTEEQAYISSKFKWGGTLLCKKTLVLQYPYLDGEFLEDTYLIQALQSRQLLQQLSDCYHLYLMVYHGNNTFNYFHFRYLIKTSYPANAESLQWMQDLTAAAIAIKLT